MRRRTKVLLKAAAAASVGTAALAGAATVRADDHHLRVIVGLATTDAKAVFWSDNDYVTLGSSSCRPPGGTGGWWHCDDGVGRPALDLLKGDGTVSETFGGCSTAQSVGSLCGTKVFFQAYNLSPSSPLVAKIFSHGTTCSGVSVRLYTPEDQTNYFARFEFVHMDESAVGQTFIIQSGWAIWEMGRVKSPDCTSSGPHLHQSGGPEGSIVAKNSGLTAPCTLGSYCSFSPTGDYTNKWMHDVFWQTFPTPTPAPTATPVPCCSGGGGK